MKKTLSIVMCVLLVLLAVACSPETHKHKYEKVAEKSVEATCTQNGTEYMLCSCGDIVIVPVQATNHPNKELVNEYKATCTNEGQKVYYCPDCTQTVVEFTAKDMSNHPWDSIKNHLTETFTAATCATEGKGKFSLCDACKSENFEATIPVDTSYHYYYDESSETYKRLAAAKTDADKADWKEYSAPTAFVGKVEKEVCKVCGKDVLSGEKNVLRDATGDGTGPDNDLILGNWFYTTETSSSEGTYKEYYITISENETASPAAYHVETYVLSYTSGVATPIDASVTVNVTGFNATTGTMSSPRTFTAANALGSGDSLTLTAVSTAGTPEGSEVGDYKISSTTLISAAAVIDAPTSHVHDFVLMEGYGAVQASYHYLECQDKDCNLKYVKESHLTGCKVCGYVTSDYVLVKIGQNGDGDIESFYIPKADKLSIPAGTTTGTTWTAFLGGEKKYKSVTVWSDAWGGSSSVTPSGTEYTFPSGGTGWFVKLEKVGS